MQCTEHNNRNNPIRKIPKLQKVPWLRTPKRTIVEIGTTEISMPTIGKKTTTKTVNRLRDKWKQNY